MNNNETTHSIYSCRVLVKKGFQSLQHLRTPPALFWAIMLRGPLLYAQWIKLLLLQYSVLFLLPLESILFWHDGRERRSKSNTLCVFLELLRHVPFKPRFDHCVLGKQRMHLHHEEIIPPSPKPVCMRKIISTFPKLETRGHVIFGVFPYICSNKDKEGRSRTDHYAFFFHLLTHLIGKRQKKLILAFAKVNAWPRTHRA